MNIAIVTGASSGMGREFVLQLPGYVNVDEIWVIARRAAALESLKSEVPVPVRPIALVKFVPHRIVMNIWLNQQKKQKNNQGLPTK